MYAPFNAFLLAWKFMEKETPEPGVQGEPIIMLSSPEIRLQEKLVISKSINLIWYHQKNGEGRGPRRDCNERARSLRTEAEGRACRMGFEPVPLQDRLFIECMAEMLR